MLCTIVWFIPRFVGIRFEFFFYFFMSTTFMFHHKSSKTEEMEREFNGFNEK